MIDQETTAAPITTEYNNGTVTAEVYEAMRGGNPEDYDSNPDRFLERIPRIAVQMVSGCTYADLDMEQETHDPDEYQAFSFMLNPSQAVRLAHRLLEIAGPLT